MEPPVGLKPRHIHEAQRIDALLEAMQRYALANQQIPLKWVQELRELVASLKANTADSDRLNVDEQRMNWLESKQNLCYGRMFNDVPEPGVQIENCGYVAWGKTLRDAIDAAMRLPGLSVGNIADSGRER